MAKFSVEKSSALRLEWLNASQKLLATCPALREQDFSVHKACRQVSKEIFVKVYEIATSDTFKTSERLKAAEMILDRAYGKARQEIVVEGNIEATIALIDKPKNETREEWLKRVYGENYSIEYTGNKPNGSGTESSDS